MQNLTADKLYQRFIKMNPDIDVHYNEPHRKYHTPKHIKSMLQYLITHTSRMGFSKTEFDMLVIATIYHDVIYDLSGLDNEARSAKYYLNDLKKLTKEKSPYAYLFADANKNSRDNKAKVYELIMHTIDHVYSSKTADKLGRFMVEMDLSGFLRTSKEVLEANYECFQEYGFAPIELYRKHRTEILEKFKEIEFGSANTNVTFQRNLDFCIQHLHAFKPKVGLYAGSFNPFHVGHKNILDYADRIFDKVIILRGINPAKKDAKEELSKYLNTYQRIEYSGLLTEEIKKLLEENFAEFTLIRGLRNAADLAYEDTQITYMREMMPELNVISILSDPIYRHISSSGERMLGNYNVDLNHIVK